MEKRVLILEVDNPKITIIGKKIILSIDSVPIIIKIAEQLGDDYGNCREKKVLNLTGNQKLQLT